MGSNARETYVALCGHETRVVAAVLVYDDSIPQIILAAGAHVTTKMVGTASKRFKNSWTAVWMLIASL